MKKFICRCIWNFSEWSRIPLGRFAGPIFGGMIGCKGIKMKPEEFKTEESEVVESLIEKSNKLTGRE